MVGSFPPVPCGNRTFPRHFTRARSACFTSASSRFHVTLLAHIFSSIACMYKPVVGALHLWKTERYPQTNRARGAGKNTGSGGIHVTQLALIGKAKSGSGKRAEQWQVRSRSAIPCGQDIYPRRDCHHFARVTAPIARAKTSRVFCCMVVTPPEPNASLLPTEMLDMNPAMAIADANRPIRISQRMFFINIS